MKGYLPVHCCCHPETRLGWVPVPPEVSDPSFRASGGRLRFRFQVPREATFKALDTAWMLKPAEIIDAEVQQLMHSDGTVEWAVKSGHLPIESWRQVPGFIRSTRRR